MECVGHIGTIGYIIVTLFLDTKLDWFENFDIHDIVTPVNANILGDLLKEGGYDSVKTKFLVEGFKNGFSLEFKGKRHDIQREAPNIKIRIGSKKEMWNKIMKEVKLGRYAGPFLEPPFKDYIQSPIGLVPKDGGKKTRLIFHLSYPRDGDSVNSGIPKEKCSVSYPDFDSAIKLCQITGKTGKMVFLGKSDMSLAFRNLPILISSNFIKLVI